ncbi:MAG: alpha/beta hydrolase [Acidimicrobiia bacterium]|nr:alpha/beta hydrolase [Acidimicrobiia bacterium]
MTVGSGRITVARTPLTETEGIWGVAGPNGYGQASVVISRTDEVVERGFRVLSGVFDVGELVAFDPIAYPGDPLEAHGIEYREVRFTGDLGVYPAWVIDGDRDAWVIIVHGAGPEQRAEALRMLPGLVAQRLSVMVMTVRGDNGAPRPTTGLRALGATEWRDLASAVEFGFNQDAAEYVLIGLDTGASVVANYLHRADDITAVRGVVYDSALFDPERIADRVAEERGVLAMLRGAGKLLASIRFDIDWNELDQIDRAPEYTVPVLVLHGEQDAVADIQVAEEFVAELGNLARFVRFETGRHGQLWNTDPAQYEEALLSFIDTVRAAE